MFPSLILAFCLLPFAFCLSFGLHPNRTRPSQIPIHLHRPHIVPTLLATDRVVVHISELCARRGRTRRENELPIADDLNLREPARPDHLDPKSDWSLRFESVAHTVTIFGLEIDDDVVRGAVGVTDNII